MMMSSNESSSEDRIIREDKRNKSHKSEETCKMIKKARSLNQLLRQRKCSKKIIAADVEVIVGMVIVVGGKKMLQ